MEILQGIFPILIFIGMLVVLVFVHELGHFLTALWMGIRVEEFGIGFPPRATTLFTHKGVDYTLNWLPLGGFVRFAGEDNVYSGASKKQPEDEDQPPLDDQPDKAARRGMTLAEAPPLRKIPVMFAGPFANLLVAVLIFAIMAGTVGINRPTGMQEITDVFPESPADEAGFQEGDLLKSFAGEPVAVPNAITNVANENTGEAVPVEIIRNGQDMTLTLTPRPWVEPESGQTLQLGFGYRPDGDQIYGDNPVSATAIGVEHSGTVLVTMWNGLGQLIGGLVGANEAPPGGVAGPIGIARATGEVIDMGGIVAFWNWMAIISLNLFLLNLLPIPALDGSHIVFSLIELARGGKKVPPEKEAMVHAIGFAALMGLIVIVSVNDVISAIQGESILGP